MLCLLNFFITFILFWLIKNIITPLPSEIYEEENSLTMIRLLKVLFIISFLFDITLIGLFVGIPSFLVLWVISYIAFGSGNPFFVFKYKPYKKSKQGKNEEYIDTEVVN